MTGMMRRLATNHRTEQTYCQWVKRFIYFHNVCHPDVMAEKEINAFLIQLLLVISIGAYTALLPGECSYTENI